MTGCCTAITTVVNIDTMPMQRHRRARVQRTYVARLGQRETVDEMTNAVFNTKKIQTEGPDIVLIVRAAGAGLSRKVNITLVIEEPRTVWRKVKVVVVIKVARSMIDLVLVPATVLPLRKTLRKRAEHLPKVSPLT